MEKGF
jgi:hypothetical protein